MGATSVLGCPHSEKSICFCAAFSGDFLARKDPQKRRGPALPKEGWPSLPFCCGYADTAQTYSVLLCSLSIRSFILVSRSITS
ncbi:hypothetical protein, partial [Azotobacter beijerinckii]|uniref:hypothetical protein n=1 Tax=Azotobacter beijerinckii TaxID=170623 RepID=UPI001B8B807D